jgi:hypothetical protein
MCETQEIRFVHHIMHPDYLDMLGVGCVCAEHMEQDQQGPRRRERELRNAAQRRRNCLKRKLRTSAAGNNYLNTDCFNITIYLNPMVAGSGESKIERLFIPRHLDATTAPKTLLNWAASME